MFQFYIKSLSFIAIMVLMVINLGGSNLKILSQNTNPQISTEYQVTFRDTKFSEFSKTTLFQKVLKSKNLTFTGIKTIDNLKVPIIFSNNPDQSVLESFNSTASKYLNEIQNIELAKIDMYLNESLKGSDLKKLSEFVSNINHIIEISELKKIKVSIFNDSDFQILGVEFSSDKSLQTEIDNELTKEKINLDISLNLKELQNRIYTSSNFNFIKLNTEASEGLKVSKENRPMSPASNNLEELKIITSDTKLKDLANFESSKTIDLLNNIQNSYNYIDKTFDVNKLENEIKQNQIRIDEEKNKAIEHNKRVKQYYTEEDLQANPNIEKQEKGEFIPSFGGIKAGAKGLNNASTTELLIYAWDNTNLAVDLPNSNSTNGTKLQLYSRNGSGAQFFQVSNDNQIKLQGKCLDIEGGNISNGTKVQIYSCNGTSAQQWIFDGIYLKVKSNTGLCLDASGGLNIGVAMQIYSCNNTSAQRWVMGTNDFSSQRSIAIYATPTGNISGGQNGHVFISFINSTLGIINTMSSWSPGNDSNSSNTGRYNNIADGDAAYVDVPDDWATANNLPSNWKMRFRAISKRIADVYRHNSGYRYGYTTSNLVNNNATISYFAILPTGNNYNCARLSTRIWNDVMNDSSLSDNITREEWQPSVVYNQI